MLYLLAATVAQAAPAPRTAKLVDCKPVLTLASARPQRREETRPKRPRPCMVLAEFRS